MSSSCLPWLLLVPLGGADEPAGGGGSPVRHVLRAGACADQGRSGTSRIASRVPDASVPSGRSLAEYGGLTMAPDRRPRARRKSPPPFVPAVRTAPSSDDAHEVVFFRRHSDDDASERTPGRDFLNACPTKVRATMRVVLAEVAAAAPKRFAGGGYWEAIKGEMSGWFEVRVDGPSRHHYRLFCWLDYDAQGVDKPLLVVIDGRDKPFRTVLAERDYRAVRVLGDEYLARNPRSIV